MTLLSDAVYFTSSTTHIGSTRSVFREIKIIQDLSQSQAMRSCGISHLLLINIKRELYSSRRTLNAARGPSCGLEVITAISGCFSFNARGASWDSFALQNTSNRYRLRRKAVAINWQCLRLASAIITAMEEPHVVATLGT